MKSFFKAQLSSLLATAADVMVMVLAVEAAGLHYTLAVLIGALSGAGTNFMINRYWSFGAAKASVKQQGLRYALVWAGSVALNVGGVYLLTGLLSLPYLFSRIIVAVSVGLGFNYVLQKQFVFAAK